MSDERPKLPRPRTEPGRNRDIHVSKATPRSGVPVPFEDEVTGVHTDTQVFRSVKRLHAELKESEARTTKAVDEVKADLKKVDEKLDKVAESNAGVVGKLEGVQQALEILAATAARPRTVSQDIHLIRQTTTETIAEKVLDDHREKVRFSRAVWLKILGGAITVFTSGAVVAWLLGKM